MSTPDPTAAPHDADLYANWPPTDLADELRAAANQIRGEGPYELTEPDADALATWMEHTADNIQDEHAQVVEHPEWVNGPGYEVVADGIHGHCHPEEWTSALVLARQINAPASASVPPARTSAAVPLDDEELAELEPREWQFAVENRVREMVEDALRLARADTGEYYDPAATARRVADEITTQWAVAEDVELARLAAALRAALAENVALRGELNAIEAVLEPALGDRWQPAVADAWSAGVRMLAAERDEAQAIVAAARREAAIVAETRSKLLALADEIAAESGHKSETARRIRLLLVRPIYQPGEEFADVH